MARRTGDGEAVKKAKLISAGMEGVHAWAMLVAQRASLRAPVATSRLANSIHTDPRGPTYMGHLVVVDRVGTILEYAQAQEYGSGLYASKGVKRKIPIVAGKLQSPPKADGKWALFFHWENGPRDSGGHVGGKINKRTGEPYPDGTFFFSYVMHPGVRAQPYLGPALEETKEDGKKLMLDAIKRHLG